MEEITLRVVLRAKSIDMGGYITYAFENLNYDKYYNQYFMCIQFPNWDQSEININDIGYVHMRYAKEGISEWYDGEKLNVYKNTYTVFLKFIKEPTKVNNEFVVD